MIMGWLDLFRKWSKSKEHVTEEAHEPAEAPVKQEQEQETIVKSKEEFPGFAPVWMVELLYRHKPILNQERLYAKMQKYTGEARLDEHAPKGARDRDPVVSEAHSGERTRQDFEPLLFYHSNYMVQYRDGVVPAQTCILPSERPPEAALYEAALQQSWHWPDARQVVGGCRYSLLLTDFCAEGLNYKERLKLFQSALCALLETAPCEAIYWKTSGKLVQPEEYLRAISEGEWLHGAMNVRLYKAEGDGTGQPEMLVDTCGLAAMGVPDLQCHFTGLDPNEVATILVDLAYYLYERGDIIRDGETIGSAESQRWRCEHQHSLNEPRRRVIDLNPGEPYSAGGQLHGR